MFIHVEDLILVLSRIKIVIRVLIKIRKQFSLQLCQKWIHRKCNGTSAEEYERLVDDDDNILWECIICEIADMASKFPFGYLTKIAVNDLFGLDLPSQLQLLLPLELRSKLSHIPSLDNFDLDENYTQSIHSKYCNLPDFVKLSSSLSDKTFSFKYWILKYWKPLEKLWSIKKCSLCCQN